MEQCQVLRRPAAQVHEHLWRGAWYRRPTKSCAVEVLPLDGSAKLPSVQPRIPGGTALSRVRMRSTQEFTNIPAYELGRAGAEVKDHSGNQRLAQSAELKRTKLAQLVATENLNPVHRVCPRSPYPPMGHQPADASRYISQPFESCEARSGCRREEGGHRHRCSDRPSGTVALNTTKRGPQSNNNAVNPAIAGDGTGPRPEDGQRPCAGPAIPDHGRQGLGIVGDHKGVALPAGSPSRVTGKGFMQSDREPQRSLNRSSTKVQT